MDLMRSDESFLLLVYMDLSLGCANKNRLWTRYTKPSVYLRFSAQISVLFHASMAALLVRSGTVPWVIGFWPVAQLATSTHAALGQLALI